MSELALRIYRRWLSPGLHAAAQVSGACRFQPTCSEYAAIAFASYGALRGSALALGRLLRCHPFSRGGFDPVPGTWPPAGADTNQGKGPLHLS